MDFINDRNKKCLFFLIVAVGVIFFSGTHLGYAGALEKTKLQIGMSTPSVAFTPLYVAENENLFQKEGFEKVELLTFKSGTDNLQAVLSNSVDFGAGAFTEAHTAVSKGAKFKVFFGLCNKSVYIWWSKPEIKSIKDAKGKKFAVSKLGGMSHIVSDWAVRRAGLDPKEVQFVQSGGPMSRLSALQGGAVDVAILSYPGNFIAKREGFNALLELADFIKGWPNEVIYSNMSFLKENPETIKAFLRAVVNAMKIVRSDEKKSLAAIAKYVKVTGEDARKAYLVYRDSYPLNGMPPLDGMDLVQDMAIMRGKLKNKIPLEDIIDYTYINMYKK